MMFDKNLFFALCEKYNIELSDTAKEPMIKDKNGIHPVTSEDINRIFASCQTSFEYTGKKLNANTKINFYDWQEDYALAC